MSSGYVSGPSRSAWEGANFWQRRNPACMSHVPVIATNDALDRYVESRRQCPSCARYVLPRGYERHLRACSLYHWKTRDLPF